MALRLSAAIMEVAQGLEEGTGGSQQCGGEQVRVRMIGSEQVLQHTQAVLALGAAHPAVERKQVRGEIPLRQGIICWTEPGSQRPHSLAESIDCAHGS